MDEEDEEEEDDSGAQDAKEMLETLKADKEENNGQWGQVGRGRPPLFPQEPLALAYCWLVHASPATPMTAPQWLFAVRSCTCELPGSLVDRGLV